jgi:hypothetical protein
MMGKAHRLRVRAKGFPLIEHRKIAVIGPTPPIRGGIARHTTAFARALAGREDLAVRIWSFSCQYPKFLYPGADERAEDGAPPGDLRVDFSIDGVNPLRWRRTAMRCSRPSRT